MVNNHGACHLHLHLHLHLYVDVDVDVDVALSATMLVYKGCLRTCKAT